MKLVRGMAYRKPVLKVDKESIIYGYKHKVFDLRTRLINGEYIPALRRGRKYTLGQYANLFRYPNLYPVSIKN